MMISRDKQQVCVGLAIIAVAAVDPFPRAAAQRHSIREADVSLFYDDLAPYGEWLQLNHYGWVWTPYGVPVGWRPYTDGHWSYVNDCGWTWVSDAPWGWAVFHYGRWTFEPSLGWVWVPGTEWAPAWVAWRSGSGYIGWSPLPPQVGWRTEIGLDFGGLELDALIDNTAWSFVEERVLLEPHVHRHVILPARNVTLLRETNNITRFTVISGTIANISVDVGHIETVVGRPIQRLRIRDCNSPDRTRGVRVLGGELAVFRPRVHKAPADVTPRIFIAPRRTEPPQRLREAHSAQYRALEADQTSDRIVLQQTHQREQKIVKDGAAAEELRRRQAEENQSIEEQERRQRDILQRWQERDSDPSPKRTKTDSPKYKTYKDKARRR